MFFRDLGLGLGQRKGGGSALLMSLVSYWKLDEVETGSPITRVDSVVASANDLTDNNTVASAVGKISNAGSFVFANSEYLSRVSNASLQTGAIDFTFAAWVNYTSVGATRIIIGKDDTGQRDYFMNLEADGRASFNVFNSGAGLSTATRPVDIGIAAWHYLIGERAGANISIYVDDGAATTVAFAGTPNAGTSDFRIGARAFVGFENYFNGLIDEVGFWKRLLTPAEKTALYNGGAGLTYPF